MSKIKLKPVLHDNTEELISMNKLYFYVVQKNGTKASSSYICDKGLLDELMYERGSSDCMDDGHAMDYLADWSWHEIDQDAARNIKKNGKFECGYLVYPTLYKGTVV